MERPNAWKGYTKKDVKELNKLSREYREFLDEGKTERECVNKAVSMAEAAGYLPGFKAVQYYDYTAIPGKAY